MADGDITGLLKLYEFADQDILTPQIVHVHGDIYAIACEVADNDGWIFTVEADQAGTKPTAIETSAEFEAGEANGIFFMHITGNVFAVLTRIDYTELRLRTISISNDGQTITNIATRNVGAPNSDYFSMCLVQDIMYAVAYSVAGTQAGIVKTFEIDSDGAISVEKGSYTFDATYGDFCVVLNVSATKCAIAYTKNATTKMVTTVSINAAGAISDVAGGPITITTGSSWSELGFSRTVDNAFVVAFKDGAADGWLKSILIDSDGVMTDPAKANLEYDEAEGSAPYIIPIGLGLCAMVYASAVNDGKVCTFTVDNEGNITEPSVHNLTFDITMGKSPHIVHAAGDTYAVVYKGPEVDGWFRSLGIETPAIEGAPKHLTMMGIG